MVTIFFDLTSSLLNETKELITEKMIRIILEEKKLKKERQELNNIFIQYCYTLCQLAEQELVNQIIIINDPDQGWQNKPIKITAVFEKPDLNFAATENNNPNDKNVIGYLGINYEEENNPGISLKGSITNYTTWTKPIIKGK